MEETLTMLLERGDVIGLLAAFGLAGAALLLKARTDRSSSKSTPPQRDAFHTVASRVDEMEKRLVRVEADVERVPTREEFHNMDRSITKLDGRIALVAQTTDQTGRAVARMEDYMLKAVEGSK